jgi:uncharacterized membrane-anchored protein
MKLAPTLCVLALSLAGLPLFSATPESTDPAARLAEARTLADSVHYRTGEFVLRGGIAKVSLPAGYKYVDPADSGTILTKLWGNPAEKDVLGMITPDDFDPLRQDSWAVILTYADDGYVKDGDAGKIDYADLMKKMKAGTAEANKEREKSGYPPIDIIGWAEAPRYEAATHKLYWAKEVRFGGVPVNTLNYNFRMLGRSGVLVLNAVAGMPQLPEVERATPTLLSMVEFQPGHRYEDFKQGTDKVATYGIAALVAGGIAAKVGLFKGLWVAILALKKFIIIAALAVARYAKGIWAKIRGKGPGDGAPPPAAPALEPPAGPA